MGFYRRRDPEFAGYPRDGLSIGSDLVRVLAKPTGSVRRTKCCPGVIRVADRDM